MRKESSYPKKQEMKLNKALTLLLIICTGSAFVFSCKPSKDSEIAQNESTRPNIVLMISDDHAYQAVSAYRPD